jgi:NADH:ubiquinone reductase (H+-translocating)
MEARNTENNQYGNFANAIPSGDSGLKTATQQTSREHVVIVGCGFGGLFAAKLLRHADVDVTVIDRTNHHLFQPLLYQVATGILSEGDIAPPIRDILRDQQNASVVFGEVVDVDVKSRRVMVDTLGFRSEIQYDSLIVATGASQSYFGHPEFAHDAPGMKTIDDALELRGRIFGAFEMAERETDPAARRRWLTFVVVGAGPTGVEVAGQLSELSRHSLRRNFRNIDPADARILLLGSAPTILPGFPESLRERALRDLQKMGVEVYVGTRVTRVDERGLATKSADPQLQWIEAAVKFWAAGVEASPLGRLLAERTGAEIDRAGRVKVEPDCTLPHYPEVFVIGDLMSLDDLPGVAQVAIQSGCHAARTIVRRIAGDMAMRPFRYHDHGTMATISRLRAIAAIGPLRVSGFLAWLLWLVVHLAALTGFKNRLSVLSNWGIAFFSQGRPQRVATAQQVFGRYALEAQAAAARHSGQTGPFDGWSSSESTRIAESGTAIDALTRVSGSTVEKLRNDSL